MGNKLNSSKSNKSGFNHNKKRLSKTELQQFIVNFHKNQLKMGINSDNLKSDQRRLAFVSLLGLYNTWKRCPVPLLYSSIFIVPLKKEWIYNYNKYCVHFQQYFAVQPNQNDISDFISLLQWKESQNLIFWMLGDIDSFGCKLDNLISPFWKDMSNKLIKLYDPVSLLNYKPLKLDPQWWETSFLKNIQPQYNVNISSILSELYFLTMKYHCIQEILYQSNPSINTIIAYDNNIYNKPQIFKKEIMQTGASNDRCTEWWISSCYYTDFELLCK